jgi:hypothetical protein
VKRAAIDAFKDRLRHVGQIPNDCDEQEMHEKAARGGNHDTFFEPFFFRIFRQPIEQRGQKMADG